MQGDSMMATMKHYVFRNKDGSVHVQNAVGGMFGQHHIHDEVSFGRWRVQIADRSLEMMEGDCDCCGKPGFGSIRPAL
ncbi:hypothetical protein LCGC14_2959270 [marine sediment metagenome]|uniref:Uncharacterized protein n=1 Tax=marine sediment metagenome TaxID=412755 RepID=A0A0F8XCN8_9ZZZZ